MEIRDSRGRFTKGNPGGGRPKKQLTTEELLQALSPEAITRLHDLIYSDNENIALRALDRVYGTPEECTPIEDRKLKIPF